jgi:hypothetical protein
MICTVSSKFGATTPSITTFSITIKNHDTQHNVSQYCYTECRLCKKAHYAECRGAVNLPTRQFQCFVKV